MIAPTIKIDQAASSLMHDFWGAFAATLVVLPSSVAFGIIVYSTLGPEYVGRGAVAGLLGAAALGVVAPVVGRTAGLISTPCAPAAALLSATIAGWISGIAGPPVPASDIPTDRARRNVIGLFFLAVCTDRWWPIDQVYSLSSGDGILVERRSNYHHRAVAQTSRPAGKYFSLVR